MILISNVCFLFIMSRSLRIEYPGAFYHVMNRGVARQHIFLNEDHYYCFLRLLEEMHRQFQIEIHAYCLMGNHYHLLIRSLVNNLSDAIRHLNGIYAKSFNKSMNRDGPLFKGRFKSILVDTESYFIQVSRYIHCNPVEANIVKIPEHYQWSSYQYFLNPDKKPHWLYRNETLSYFQNNTSLYKTYVSSGVDEHTKMFFQSKSPPLPVFGSETLVKDIVKEKEIRPNNEISGTTKIFDKTQPSITEIVDSIAKKYKIEKKKIIHPQTSEDKQLRNTVIYVCARSARKRHQAISEFFKSISRSGVSQICQRLDKKIRLNDEIAKEIEKINAAF